MSAVVQIEPATVEAQQLWERALELAAEFGADEPWALVESDRQDLLRLLSFVEDPRALAEGLKATEKRWLREVDELLGFESDDSLSELFSPEELTAAAGAYRLLLG
jgi:hypothetical protein